MYDVIIIGAGPAGITAGIYAARKKLKTILLSKELSDQVKIDLAEHSEYKWIKPKEITKFDCVAGAKEDLESVGLL